MSARTDTHLSDCIPRVPSLYWLYLQLLANMEFRPTDHASERQLKLDVISVYNRRLDEREKRKKFVIEHNLLDYKKQQIGGKKRPKVCMLVPISIYGDFMGWVPVGEMLSGADSDHLVLVLCVFYGAATQRGCCCCRTDATQSRRREE